jgi:hypothetical protein
MSKEVPLGEAIHESDTDVMNSIVQPITTQATLIRIIPGDTLAIKIPSGLAQSVKDNAVIVLRRHLPAGVNFIFYTEDKVVEFGLIKGTTYEAGD